jgi:glycerophosphoryl diester phosphodiesterase
MTRPQVVAHRGSSARHADNSWAAFEAATVEGADAIECDVQATRDRVIVVRHDLAIDNRLVTDLCFAELDARAPGIVLFADLLAFAEGCAIDLLVEIKDPDATEAVAQMICASARRDRIVVGGFHGPALATVKAIAPAVRTSFMIGSVVGSEELIRLAAAFRVDGVHLCWESRAPRPRCLLDCATIDRVRRAGLAITLWHEDREDELRALVALEPDAICTNTPAVLRRIVDAHRDLSDAERNGAARDASSPHRVVSVTQSTRQEES